MKGRRKPPASGLLFVVREDKKPRAELRRACPACGQPALDGHITCGQVQCDEGGRRRAMDEQPFDLEILASIERKIGAGPPLAGIFRNDAQRNQVVIAMLGALGLEHLWTPTGPTEEACKLHKSGGGYLSSGERTLVSLAFDVYDGEAHTAFDRLLYNTDLRIMRMMGEFLTMFAAGQIDLWLCHPERWRE